MNLASSQEKPVNKPVTAKSDLTRLVAVMEMLRNVIEEENAFLRTGLPSTLFTWREAKQDLSDQYADLTGRIARNMAAGHTLDNRQLKSLIDGTLALKGLADENMALLDGAITASRRRVEAVMSAVRSHRSYAGEAVSMAARFVPGSTRLTV
jgi:hypothetical protein